VLLTVIFAALGACANALSSVMQRKAAAGAPEAGGESALLLHELRRPAFLIGIVGLIAGFLLQAAALSHGPLTVVQPVLVSELPLTLLLAALVFRTPIRARDVLAAAAVAAGVALALVGAAPSDGSHEATSAAWVGYAGTAAAALAVLAFAGWRSRGNRRAAVLGVVAGGGFALTATFMAPVTARLADGLGVVASSWQLYAMVAAGIAAVLTLQNAYQAGSLAISQPGVTIADPVLAVVLGVLLFDERVRLGWFLLPELVGVAAIVVGVVILSRSITVTGAEPGTAVPSQPEPRPRNAPGSASARGRGPG
jgi:drug/metabolite transporter (DMT)-like permease